MNPLGGDTYEITATVPFKDADGNMYGGRALQGYQQPNSSFMCAIDLPGTETVCGHTITSTLSGVTEGDIGFYIPSVTFPSDATDILFDAYDNDSTSLSHPVSCPLP